MNKKSTTRQSETDWERLKNMKDEDIDFTDIPRLTPEMFAKGVVRKGFTPIPRKHQITLRLDDDVLSFFREFGQGYQTKINQLLRAYMEAHNAK